MDIFRNLLLFSTCLVLIWPEKTSVAQSSFPFVVPGNDATSTITDQSHLLHRPAGKFGFVEALDGHFYFPKDNSTNNPRGQRLRMWGVNLCFGANFPTHTEADLIAPHLSKLGLNAVRFHHADNSDAPSGIWGSYDAEGIRQLSPEMVDRLDYFLAKLHEVGIYADLNLHVSRQLTEREGFPVLKDAPWWAASNKYVMYYDRDVQAELKRFCREFLTHSNPYRNLRRVDDPGIAIIELLNENYFSEQGYSLVSKLPERFQTSFQQRWNEWLRNTYSDHKNMVSDWNAGEKGLGAAIIAVEKWQSQLGKWSITRSESDLPRRFGRPGPKERPDCFALRIEPRNPTEHDHQQQLVYQQLSVKQNQDVTLSFWVRADVPRKIIVELSSLAGGEWRELGLFEKIDVGTQWQNVVRVISPKETASNKAAYVAISFGTDKTPLEFSGIELLEGSPQGKLPNSQLLSSQNIGIPDATFPTGAHRDMKRFMVDTERAWIRELKGYVRELGVKAPITGSQINYHAPGIVSSELDFADLHNYWHHPMFSPGKEWSATDWTVGNQPMEAGPNYSKWPANSLLTRTGWRIDGMPMTLSEWNYPEPSVFSAGCVPMAAMIACLQDWDAVFFFDYEAFAENESSRRPFFKERTNNFFSFNGAPAKLTALSVFANVYLRGDLKPLNDSLLSPLSKPLPGTLAMQKRIGVSKNASTVEVPTLPDETNLSTPDNSIQWRVEKHMERGTIQMNTERTLGVWGTIANQSYQFQDQRWRVGNIDRDYGILVATSMDNLPVHESKQVLLLAATHTENTDMIWNADRTSVGTQWGKGPTKAVAINATIALPCSSQNVRVNALDGTGKYLAPVECRVENGVVHFEIGDQFRTMWYSIECD